MHDPNRDAHETWSFVEGRMVQGRVPDADWLNGVHPRGTCAGEYCVVHHPSAHHMRDWELCWDASLAAMTRTCPHRVTHPDPDDMAYHRARGAGGSALHHCDGCCYDGLRALIDALRTIVRDERRVLTVEDLCRASDVDLTRLLDLIGPTTSTETKDGDHD